MQPIGGGNKRHLTATGVCDCADPLHALDIGHGCELAGIGRTHQPVHAGFHTKFNLSAQAFVVNGQVFFEGGYQDDKNASPTLVRHELLPMPPATVV